MGETPWMRRKAGQQIELYGIYTELSDTVKRTADAGGTGYGRTGIASCSTRQR